MTSFVLRSQAAQSLLSMVDTIDFLPFFSHLLTIHLRHLRGRERTDEGGDEWKMIIELNNSYLNEAERQ